eukprot:CAMPEP_0178443744 /NCGR_PEP_ID=MMETSP0689_2-20121128/39082_1 /TAXON_ID=160604 /ORGANISM="Amphidinium massartii, Strain CS-259" /LENGTH=280 /DNA_ID=CAMNT_0020067819 /DNA_START=270 /DNA_END=1112 /DNA_ORIENTATION=+
MGGLVFATWKFCHCWFQLKAANIEGWIVLFSLSVAAYILFFLSLILTIAGLRAKRHNMEHVHLACRQAARAALLGGLASGLAAEITLDFEDEATVPPLWQDGCRLLGASSGLLLLGFVAARDYDHPGESPDTSADANGLTARLLKHPEDNGMCDALASGAKPDIDIESQDCQGLEGSSDCGSCLRNSRGGAGGISSMPSTPSRSPVSSPVASSSLREGGYFLLDAVAPARVTPPTKRRSQMDSVRVSPERVDMHTLFGQHRWLSDSQFNTPHSPQQQAVC